MKRFLAASLSAAALCIAGSAGHADTPAEAQLSTDELVSAAEARMAMTFQNMSIVDFRESPLNGLYQADIGGRVVYYSPEPELLIFGEMYDRTGVNLTARAQQETLQKKLGALELDDALVIGPPNGVEIVEFSNPNCGYCRALDRFFRVQAEEAGPIRRRVIFAAFEDNAAAKAEHILCSEDPEQAFEEIYGGTEPREYATCPDGRATLEAHVQMSRSMGVAGTPTLLLDGRPVEGFRQGEILAFLNSKRTSTP